MLTGSGSEAASSVPVAVDGNYRFRSIQAGGTATCGIASLQETLCWGLNSNGAVGQSNLGP
jgi:hypothetical protein